MTSWLPTAAWLKNKNDYHHYFIVSARIKPEIAFSPARVSFDLSAVVGPRAREEEDAAWLFARFCFMPFAWTRVVTILVMRVRKFAGEILLRLCGAYRPSRSLPSVHGSWTN